MSLFKNTSIGFFWKISFTMLALLIIIGFSYVFISANLAEKFVQERNQRLNTSIASHVISEVKPFINGELSENATDEIMHHMMAINPSIEVYLLNPGGKILNYVAPYKKIKMDSVSLTPINEFIVTKGEAYIVGDDPRNPGIQKVFSAAPIMENNTTVGYVYIVLASEEFLDTGVSWVISNDIGFTLSNDKL
ncbi:MAG: hypothetical protein AAFN93_16395, partial [Bacteroidota bacterium]